MHSVQEELEFRVNFHEKMAKTRPVDTLSSYEKSNIFGDKAWKYYHLYIYQFALGYTEEAQENLHKMVEMSQLAMEYLPTRNLKRLEAIFLAKALLGEDLSDTAKQVISLAPDDSDHSVSPLYTVLSCVLLGEDYSQFNDWLEKKEKNRNTLELLGTARTIHFLANRDEEALVSALNDLLLVHHKEVNSKTKHANNTPAAFLSIAPYLIMKVAKVLGLDIQSNITKNKKTLKLSLRFPRDFPEISRDLKMSVNVDYLSAQCELI